ncbi:ABC transporter permease [Microbacteriaceae bacterium 4G12]
MSKMWAICVWELQRLLKKRQSYILMFALPLVFTLLFGSVLGGSGESKVPVLFVDEDQSALSKAYYEEIKDNNLMQLKTDSLSDAQEQVKKKKASAIIVLPKGFQEKLLLGQTDSVSLQHSPDFTTSTTIVQFLNDAVTKTQMQTKAAQAWSRYTGEPWERMQEKLKQEAAAKPVALQTESVTKSKKEQTMSNMSGRAAGFSIMFVMFVMMSATGAILEARKTGVWYRLLSTPVTKAHILGGYVLSFFILGWIQFGTLMLMTHWLFDVQWGDGLGIVALVSALLLAIVGLALFLAGMVKTVEQQSALGNIVIVSTCMIGGVYWPIEIEPTFMQRIADFVPQMWAMRGFTELMARGGSFVDISMYALILLAFAAVFFTVGLSRIRYE